MFIQKSTDRKKMRHFGLSLILGFSFSSHAIECEFRSHKVLGQEVLNLMDPRPICHKNKIHLTFDDGPSGKITPLILNELYQRNIQATFFITTTNLDTGGAKQKENELILRQTLADKHLLASHGHDHDAYDLRMNKEGVILSYGLTKHQQEEQASKSLSLLNRATLNEFSHQKNKLFRFPYGRGAMPSEKELNYMIENGLIKLKGTSYQEQLAHYRQISEPLKTIWEQGLSHLGWNHDSSDSAYEVKAPGREEIKKYILKNLQKLCEERSSISTKVALFHDIKEINIQAIAIIIDIGQCLGLKFISAEEMLKGSELTRSGVLIHHPGPYMSSQQNNQSDSAKKSCQSHYRGTLKIYKHCEGEDFICLDGLWKNKLDPEVKKECKRKEN